MIKGTKYISINVFELITSAIKRKIKQNDLFILKASSIFPITYKNAYVQLLIENK